MRIYSKPLVPMWTADTLARIGTIPTHGISSCGRVTVSRFGFVYTIKGNHSRRRCTDRTTGTVTNTPKWKLIAPLAHNLEKAMRYRADYSETDSSGAVAWYAKWMSPNH